MAFRDSSARVHVIPNASWVRGRFLDARPAPTGEGSIWSLEVTQADDVSGYPNFVRDRVGQTIEVFVAAGSALEVAVNDRVAAEIAYRGDERGGTFVVRGEVTKL
jgi:hypothetical protein